MLWNRIIPGVIFIIISTVFFIETKKFPEKLGKDVGAAFWPKILICLLIIMSLWLIFTGLQKRRKLSDKKKMKFSLIILKPYLGMIICIGFVILFKPLGYIISVFLFYILLAHTMFGRFNWKFFWGAAIQATLLVLTIYILFVKLLSVNLPVGIFS